MWRAERVPGIWRCSQANGLIHDLGRGSAWSDVMLGSQDV